MTGRIPHEIRDVLARLVRVHGDAAVVDACSQLVATYAARGARAAVADRDREGTESCPRCTARDRDIKRIRDVTTRVSRAMPRSGATTTNDE